jgi:hypothetical protein
LKRKSWKDCRTLHLGTSEHTARNAAVCCNEPRHRLTSHRHRGKLPCHKLRRKQHHIGTVSGDLLNLKHCGQAPASATHGSSCGAAGCQRCATT